MGALIGVDQIKYSLCSAFIFRDELTGENKGFEVDIINAGK